MRHPCRIENFLIVKFHDFLNGISCIDLRPCAVSAVLNKGKKLTAADIRVLRENAVVFPYLTSKYDPFEWRMGLELTDAIDDLNKSSSRLMWVAIAIGAVGVIATVASIFIR